MSFLSRKQKSKQSSDSSPLLALDLGASGVKCLLAVLESDSLRILSKSFSPHPSNSYLNSEVKVYSTLLATCRTALSTALAAADLPDAHLQPKDVIIGFSGEEIILKTHTIRYRRPTPNSPLTRQELDLLYKRIEKKASESLPDSALLDSRPLSLAIDGYKPLTSVGFKGEDLIVNYLTSFAPAALVKNINRLCTDLNLYPLALTSNAYAFARACLGPDLDPDLSALAVDIGARTTNISLIDSGEILGTTSFSLAGNTFTHQVSETLGISESDAEYDKLNLEDDSLLSDVVIGATSAALSRTISVWLSAFALALEDLAELAPSLPPVLIFAGGSSKLLPLRELISTADWPASVSFANNLTPECYYFSATDFPGFKMSEELSSVLTPEYFSALGLLRIAAD